MGMTIAEKILARKSGLASVTPGQIVDAYPDLVMSHTATWRSVSVMEKVGATKLYDPDRIAVVLDHIAPAKSEKNAADHLKYRTVREKVRHPEVLRRRCGNRAPGLDGSRTCSARRSDRRHAKLSSAVAMRRAHFLYAN